MMQAINLGIPNREEEINRVLKIVRMEDNAKIKFKNVKAEEGYLRVYDVDDTATIVKCLLENGHGICELQKNKIGLEEYYIDLMSKK